MKKIVPISIESILLIILFLLLLISGPGFAADREPLKLPMPDEFVSALQKDGSPQYIKAEQIEKLIRQHSNEFQALYWNKNIKQFIIPSHDWLENLLDTFDALMYKTKVQAKADTWDCENYSELLNALVTVRIWKAGYYDTRAAIGWMRVNAKNEWAGLPGVMHALMFGVTEKGLFVIEPQNGEYVELEDYPNKEFIQEVFLF